MIQNGQWPEIPDGDGKVDEELRDWIIAETKITDAEEGRRDVWATTARDRIDDAVHSNGVTQTWVRNARDPLQNDHSSVYSPYSRTSTSTNPLFERHKISRKGLPVEFPGKHRELDLVPGSVFLVDSKGSFLKLPIPSGMPEDPLRWGYWKKTGAIACLLFYTMLSISSCQLPEINFQLLLHDPTVQVSEHVAKSPQQNAFLLFVSLTISLTNLFALEHWSTYHPAIGCLSTVVRWVGFFHLGAPVHCDWSPTCAALLHRPSSRWLHHRCYRQRLQCPFSRFVRKRSGISACLEPGTVDHHRLNLHP